MTPNREASQPAESRRTLSQELAGPVELELAKAVESYRARNGLLGGSRYELKYDGTFTDPVNEHASHREPGGRV